MFPEAGTAPVDLARFPACRGVLDLVFNPLRTALLLMAKDRGIPCANGLGMLVSQAKRAAELFTSRAIDPALEAQAVSAVTRARANLVLIGMPGCGQIDRRPPCRQAARPAVCRPGRAHRGAGGPLLRRHHRAGRRGRLPRRRGPRRRRSRRGVRTGDRRRRRHRAAAGRHGRAAAKRLRDLARPAAQPARHGGRPLSEGGAALERLFAARAPLYRRYADRRLSSKGTPARTAGAACAIFETEEWL